MKKTRTTLQYKNEDKTRYNSKTRTTRTPEKKPEAEKQPEAIELKMDNPESTQDEEKLSKNTIQYVLDTTTRK
jgi:hypothetical protein